MTEKRRAARLELNAVLKLNEVETKKSVDGLAKEPFDVQVLNVSRGGIAFKCNQELRLNTYYDIHVVLWTKASFDSVIEVVRMESIDGDDIMYGCKFIGLKPSQELEIQIYETLQGLE
jgi:hypothetical protein